MRPRILRMEIAQEDAGKTIKEYLMKGIGFSSKQLSRFKYRRDGILLNGEKRYVNALLRAGDILEIRLTQGGEPVEEHPHDALRRGVPAGGGEAGAAPSPQAGKRDRVRIPEGEGGGCGSPYEAGAERREAQADPGAAPGRGTAGYARARDGRLQKIWAPPAAWLAARHPLRILYEDQDILAADKPSGVVCHPSPGHYDDTLSNQVAEHLGRTGQELDVRVTGRLDRDTSGIVVFALNTETAAQLIKQRQASLMHKLYIARVRGHFSHGSTGPECLSGTVDRPLSRESRESFRMAVSEDGKAARTHYRVLRELEDGTSVVACRIEHGRTHQIRVHMAFLGHPVVGDPLYGPEAEKAAPDAPMMLHAYRAGFRQPFTGEEIRIEAPLPAWAGCLGREALDGFYTC